MKINENLAIDSGRPVNGLAIRATSIFGNAYRKLVRPPQGKVTVSVNLVYTTISPSIVRCVLRTKATADAPWIHHFGAAPFHDGRVAWENIAEVGPLHAAEIAVYVGEEGQTVQYAGHMEKLKVEESEVATIWIPANRDLTEVQQSTLPTWGGYWKELKALAWT